MTPLTAADATDLFRRAPNGYVDVGDGEVAFRRVGRGPDVLFVHGWPVSGATFRGLLPHLVDHVTCHVIDLPGTGSSHFDATTEITMRRHVESVRRVVDQLDLSSFAVVGHDSGGMVARHAFAGDARCRAVGLVNTEQSGGSSWRFRAFLAARHLPGTRRALAAVAGSPRVRRVGLVFGDAFEDRSRLDGDFDEFFLQPLRSSGPHLDAAVQLFRTFDMEMITELADVHRRIDVPVRLVWGDSDPFFPIGATRSMVATFANAELVELAGGRLFVHEERPAEVAAALLPVLGHSA